VHKNYGFYYPLRRPTQYSAPLSLTTCLEILSVDGITNQPAVLSRHGSSFCRHIPVEWLQPFVIFVKNFRILVWRPTVVTEVLRNVH
jgi:hypothetical protein